MKKEAIKMLCIISLIFVALLVIICAENSDSSSNSEWKSYGRSANNNRYYPYGVSTNISTLSVATYTTPGAVSTPVSIANGFLYFGSGTGNKLFQMNFSNLSQQIANFSASGTVSYSPAIANGYVYFSGGSVVYQVNASNISQQISNYTASTTAKAPIIAGDYLYFNAGTVIYQLNASNISQQISNYTSAQTLIENPAYSNGYIYITEGGITYATRQLNASNVSHQITSRSSGGRYIDSPAVVSGDYVYACTSRFLMQLNSTNISSGSINSYTFNPSSSYDCYVAPVSANGSVYFASTNPSKIWQVNESNVSQLLGSYSVNPAYYTNFIVATNSSVFLGSPEGKLYQFNSSNISNLIGFYNLGTSIVGPVIADGRIFFSKSTTTLYEINATDDITDTVLPLFSNYEDNNATLTDSGMGLFNVTLTNTNGTVWINVNNTNIFATNLGDNKFNASYNFTRRGTYNYTWYAYGNGTSNRISNPGQRSYLVNSGPTSLIGLSWISPTQNLNVTQNRFFNIRVNVSCSVVDCGEINVSLDPISTKVVYNYTGGIQTFTVPNGITRISIKAWGAGGGGGWLLTPYSGGAGGFASGDLNVTPGQVFYLVVGGGGAGAKNSSGMNLGGYGGGGNSCSSTYPHGGGAGGGYSGIFNSSTISQVNAKIIAGGGGGGRSYAGTRSGGGGGLVGGGGNAGGGTQSAGGTGGVSGSALQGASASSCSGSDGADGPGGGGGYFGGGGYPSSDGGDSGGGSGYLHTSIMSGFLSQGSNSTAASSVNPPNISDLDYANSAGVSGSASTLSSLSASNGSHGLIVISYAPADLLSKSGLVPVTEGATPFYTTLQNPRTITLNSGESTTITWPVNATGDLDGKYEFFIYANKTSDDSVGNITSKINITIVNATPDTSGPEVSLISPVSNSGNQEDVIFSYSASDESSISNCSLYLNSEINQTDTTGSLQFSVEGLRVSRHNWSISCIDEFSNTGSSETRFFSVIKNNFTGSTTNLSNKEVDNVENLIIENEGNGKIVFLESVNLSNGADFNSNINISENRIEINSTVLSALNKSAKLYLYGLSFNSPQILKDGEVCSSCIQESYSSGTLIFNVTGFSVYYARENASADSGSPTSTPSTPSAGGGSSRECEKDSSCKAGYVCYSYKCVKLFDIKVLGINSPASPGKFINFSYFMKGMAEIKGDVIVKFWLEKNNKRVTEGQDTIYLGVFEEKNESSSIFIPSNIENGVHRFYVQVNFENYSAESYKDIEIIRKDNEIEIIDSNPENNEKRKLQINYLAIFKAIVIALLLSAAFLLFLGGINIYKKIKTRTNHPEIAGNPCISSIIGKKVYDYYGNYVGSVQDAYLSEFRIYGLTIIKGNWLKRFYSKPLLIQMRNIKSISDAVMLNKDVSDYLLKNN